MLEKIKETEFLYRFLQQKIRPDSREFTESRNLTVKRGVVSSAVGSAQVRLGNTIVTSAIKAEIVVPSWEAKSSGNIIVNVDLPALCHSQIKPGPPNEITQATSEYLNRIIQK
jgi:exosome complex component RRP43